MNVSLSIARVAFTANLKIARNALMAMDCFKRSVNLAKYPDAKSVILVNTGVMNAMIFILMMDNNA